MGDTKIKYYDGGPGKYKQNLEDGTKLAHWRANKKAEENGTQQGTQGEHEG